MNLGQYIAQQLLEGEELQKTIAIFPGAFKPPHKGHFEVVKKLLDKADQVVVLISPKERGGISADESLAVWNVYKHLLEPNVEIRIAAVNPVKEAYDVVKNNPDTKFILAFGKDEAERFKHITQFPDKYKNAEILNAGNYEGLNATLFRNALQSKDLNKIKDFLPDNVNPIDVESIFNPTQPEEEKPEEINPLDNQPNTLDNEQPLQEIQLGREPSPYQDYIRNNEDKVEAAAEYFNYPIPDLMYAFFLAKEVVVSDDIWSKLENSNSYEATSLEEVIKMAQKENIDIRPYVKAIKNEEQLPFPLIFNYMPDKYYLVGGNMVLSLYKVLNVIPVALVATLDLQDKKDISKQEYELKELEDIVYIDKVKTKDEQIDLINKFLKYAVEFLDLHEKPKGLTISYDTDKARTKHTFGYFEPETKKIWLYAKDRNLADMLRTLGHELVHLKQAEDGRIDHTSGETGSPIENEANAVAGVLLRNFGKENENIYEALEPKKISKFKIYCDMDGVLVDFEDGYERLTGKNIRGNHVKGDDDFWKPITDAGVKFWTGLKWMPDGHELWNYIKGYNPELLSAPSREESSKIGKFVWVKRNIPGTKLLLKSAERKQDYATPNSILIDDRADNVQRWKDAGGIGIHHTSAANTIQQLKDIMGGDLNENYKPEDEIFSAYHGRYVFNVSKAYDLIKKGKIKTVIQKRDYTIMHHMAHPEFSQADPEKYKKMVLDYDQPLGLLVNYYDPEENETEWLLIDGNHRTRKAVDEKHWGKYILVPNVEDTAKFLTINNNKPRKLFLDDED
jgi:cytidyltransferase-like protein